MCAQLHVRDSLYPRGKERAGRARVPTAADRQLPMVLEDSIGFQAEHRRKGMLVAPAATVLNLPLMKMSGHRGRICDTNMRTKHCLFKCGGV